MATAGAMPAVADRDMAWIPAGRFTMGSDDHYPEERPSRPARVDGFWIDRMPVTNAAFARFMAATGHVTVAETAPDPADYPGALPENLVPASLLFVQPSAPVALHGPITQWWQYTAGADWRHPTGPESSLDGLDDHPVVHVALADVEAYAAWAGLALPTEAEWEYAARGGLEGAEYAWGDVLMPDGKAMANTWQGAFPMENQLEDGWLRTSPVGTYPPNGHGLYDMIGNVWEWTADWWSLPGARIAAKSCCGGDRPRPPTEAGSVAPGDPIPIPRRVLKGGSHLCAPSYCRRYRPAARHAHPIDTPTSHIGFRCVYREGAGE
ncbi:formylglycine-generating enzyme family protein [Edaphosphingomonas haloaromaticamans]|uniref:Serine/threonine-protein kinase pkn1 n=1 Tax=Edaphosphingomonas haloaromaticamans TaxID=653954 RepID=A0A1S1H9Y4_9SPHN|nr:formylglycine-generating enzyme family protein [Sphingomonas haloaromaticamans]OHT18642.1 Serine/threonine-protein kinase pkn1 [Sphingomonas haloaromaticamans]